MTMLRVDATGDASGFIAALADFDGRSSPLAGPKRTDGRTVGYLFQRGVDAPEGVLQERGQDRRNMTAGASDNIGPERRKLRRDRRATLPISADRNIANPVVESNTKRGGLIKRTDRNLGVKNTATRTECDVRPNTKRANMTNDDNRRALAWQTVGLLGLVLAYLQYYFLDVHLQMAQLPSVVVLLVG